MDADVRTHPSARKWRIVAAVISLLIAAGLAWNASELHYKNCLTELEARDGRTSDAPLSPEPEAGTVTAYKLPACSRLP
jgi:hypothetical protein